MENEEIKILHSDEHIVVAVKPRGLVSETGCKDSFPDRLARLLSDKDGADTALFAVHRLDRETEGIMVYAKSAASAASLSKSITEGRWEKIYKAVLCKTPAESEGELHDLLYYDRARSKSFVVTKKRQGVKSASLSYKLLESYPNGCSLIEVRLGTGRTHQIRVQFASRAIPLCGDRRYGAPAEYGNSLALCAYKLSFPHPKDGEQMSFETEAVFDF